MANVHDVAACILEKRGPLTTWKLQKLVYYAQAWHAVWNEKRLFDAKIEAWANGPVVPELYHLHKGKFQVDQWPQGDSSNLDPDQRHSIDEVLAFYGDKSSQWLSDMTHAEKPWQQARKGLPPGERGSEEITLESMLEYYESLSAA